MSAREEELAEETRRLWRAFEQVLATVNGDFAGVSDALDTLRTTPRELGGQTNTLWMVFAAHALTEGSPVHSLSESVAAAAAAELVEAVRIALDNLRRSADYDIDEALWVRTISKTDPSDFEETTRHTLLGFIVY